MARVSKTSPFRPRGQAESSSNTEGDKKDEENNASSSGTTSITNPEENTQHKKQEKAKGRARQAKTGNQKTTLYESIFGPERANKSVVKRGRGKSAAYTRRLCSNYNIIQPRKWIEAHRARGTITKRGRGKSAGYTLGRQSKGSLRLPRKGTDVHVSSELQPVNGDPQFQGKEQEDKDVFEDSETDSEEVCKRIKFERHNDDDTDGGGAGTHRNLTSFGIELVGK